jgi:predicted membrane GTPase involved in stress response
MDNLSAKKKGCRSAKFQKEMVKVQDLRADGYEPVRVDFNVPFQYEIGYRVKFLGQTEVLIDRMEVVESGVGQR